MKIRCEAPADFGAISEVVSAAWAEADGTPSNRPPIEVRIVELIRDSENYIPDLSLVAESEAGIVGHIMFSHVELRGEETIRILALAPMAVLPNHQRTGIGGALVRAGLEKADALKESLVVLVGHADYHPRFGFEPARRSGIEPPWPDLPDEVWMVKPLSSYSEDMRGTVRYPPAFDET